MTLDMLKYIPNLFFLLVVAFLIAYLVWSFISFSVDVRYQESSALVNSLIYSENGISYKDPDTGRLYPGVIDLSRFNEYVVENNFVHPNNNFFTMKLVLFQPDTIINGVLNGEEKEVIYNKYYYGVWGAAERMKAGGPGGATMFNFDRYVLIKTDDTLEWAQMNITVLVPNE